MKKNFLVVSLFVLSSFIALCQTPNEISKELLNNIKTKGFEYALSNIPKDSMMSIPTKNYKIIQQYNNQTLKLGSLYGFEELKNDTIAKCFELKTYVLKFENAPLKLLIAFYKPNDKWFVHNLAIVKFNKKIING